METDHTRAKPTDRQLVRLVQQMLDLEEVDEVELLSPKEEYAVHVLKQTLRQEEDAHYTVGCVWKPGDARPPLGPLRYEPGRLAL